MGYVVSPAEVDWRVVEEAMIEAILRTETTGEQIKVYLFSGFVFMNKEVPESENHRVVFETLPQFTQSRKYDRLSKWLAV